MKWIYVIVIFVFLILSQNAVDCTDSIGVKFNNLTHLSKNGTCTNNCKFYMNLCLSFSENLNCSLFNDTTLSWEIKPGESQKFALDDQLTGSHKNPITSPLKTRKLQEVVLLADIWRNDTTPIFIEQLRIEGLPFPIIESEHIGGLQINNCSTFFCLGVSLYTMLGIPLNTVRPPFTPHSNSSNGTSSLVVMTSTYKPTTGNITGCVGKCPSDTTGEDVTQGKFFWKAENGNTWQNASCPYGALTSSDEEAVRFCMCDQHSISKKPFWLEPDTRVCKFKVINDSEVTTSLSGIFQMLSSNKTSRQNASEQLLNITIRADEFEAVDVILSTLILENLARGAKDLNKTGSNIVKIVDNILKAESAVVSESHRSSNTSSRLIKVIEEYLDNVPLQDGKSLTQNEPNIGIHVEEFNATDFEGAGAASIARAIDNFAAYDKDTDVQSDISKVSITLPRTLFKNADIKYQNQRISFVVYRSTSFFITLNQSKLDLKAETIRKKNSYVISGSVKDQRLTNLVDPVVTTYQPLEEGIEETTECVFWNFAAKKGTGDWSSAGCSYQGTMDGLVRCHCTHLTNFAILMDVHIDDRHKVHDKALSIISYVGCAVSMVGLILTIITILKFKNLRSKAPTQILLNFCVSLSLTLIVFLAAAERSKTSSLVACRAAAIALHYFVLAMFTWTSVNAYNMYLAFVKVLPTYHSRFMLKCCVVGWGLPAVIVLITAATSIEKYGDENFCRVQGLAFQLGFLAPVLIIILFNSIAFIQIIRSLLNSGTLVTATKRATGLQQARRGAAILVVLGLTWLFGVLAIRDAKLVFQYLFCIFNSIQGLLVFLFYCVRYVKPKREYRLLLLGKMKIWTKTGKYRVHGTSSERRSHEVYTNTKRTSDAYTTSADGSPSLSAFKTDFQHTTL